MYVCICLCVYVCVTVCVCLCTCMYVGKFAYIRTSISIV